MLVFILFVFVKSLFVYRCVEFKSLHVLDCSSLGISTFPHHARWNWVDVLILKKNNITRVNLTAIMMDFPNIQHINLWYNPFECTEPLRAGVDIISDCPHSTVRLTISAIYTSTIHRGYISVPGSAATRTAQVKTVTPFFSTPSPTNASAFSPTGTDENYIPLVLSILLPAGAVAFIIVSFYAIRRRRRRRPSVYDKLFVLNRVRSHFSIDSLSSDSLNDEVNYSQDSAF
jgi:hypothetical protein